MAKRTKELDPEIKERLKFWSEFLNTEEGRLIVGDLGKGEMKQFHADGLLFELTISENEHINVKFVCRK
ncbi:MAG: hypothetical protein ACXADC_09455 [Candidatus Thorarchaeota archaeon]